MSDPPSTYHHGDLPNALLTTAIELVDERGVEDFSLREAARRVGVTPSAVYRHFADKEALLAAVAEHGFARLGVAMEAETEAATVAMGEEGTPGLRARRELEAIGRSYVVFAVENPAQFRVMFGPHGAGSRRNPRGTGPSGLDPYELLGRGLERLADAGLISEETRAGAEVVLWSAVHGYASLLIDGPFQHEPGAADRAAIDAVVTASIDGLIARSSRGV